MVYALRRWQSDLTSRLWVDLTPRVWAGAGVYDVPGSIPADGTSEVTAALQAWLDTVPDGGVARLAPGGVYNTEGTLLLKDRRNVVFDGNGATLVAFTDGAGASPPDPAFAHKWPRARGRIIIFGGDNVTVTGFVLRGGHPNGGTDEFAYVPALEAQHGVTFQQTVGSSFTNSQVFDVYGDFAYSANSHDILISGLHCRRNGRQGVAVSSGTNIWVTGNDMADMRRAAFDLETNNNNEVIDNVHIEGNTTVNHRLLWLANAGNGYHQSNIFLRGNNVGQPVGFQVLTPTGLGGKRGPYFVEGNTFDCAGSSSASFGFTRCTAVYFRENTVSVPANRHMTVVRCREVDVIEFAKNEMTGQAVDLKVEPSP